MMAIESMACGKPSIVFEGTALPEVTFAPNGALAVAPRVDELVSAMKHLLVDARARQALGAEARNIAVQNYDFSLHVDRMERLYEKALNDSGKVKSAAQKPV
jgi:Glycosyltransferase